MLHVAGRLPSALLLAFAVVVPVGVRAQSEPCQALNPICGGKADRPLAIFGSEEVTLADLDADTRTSITALETAIKAARLAVLQSEIEKNLFELESRRQHISFKRFLYQELMQPVPRPSEEAVQREIAAHPDRYKGEEAADFASGQLFDRDMASHRRDFTAALAKKYDVRTYFDGGLLPSARQVVATVGRRRILARDIARRALGAEIEERISAAEAEKEAVERVIHERLVRSAAEARHISPDELTRLEVTSRIVEPTESELRAAWASRRLLYGADFDRARNDVRDAVVAGRRKELESALDEKWRGGKAPDLHFEVPAIVAVPLDVPQRSRDARDTVVLDEWGDFQCPPCGWMSEIVEEAIRPYGSRVAYQFHNFPLSMHRWAWKAAEASLAARAQGKLEPYMRLLFHNQESLDLQSLRRFAQQTGLDLKRFDEEMTQGRYAPDVLLDKYAGERAGVNGTPMFFVNGVRLGYDAYDVTGLRAAIDAQLKRR